MSFLPSSERRTLGQRKEIPFPVDVPVSMLYPNWKYARTGVIKTNGKTDSMSGYRFHWGNKGDWRSVCIGNYCQIIVLETGEVWSCFEN